MHYKIASPNSWNLGEQITQRIKLASDGLRGNDRRELIKRSSHAFANLIDTVTIGKDETPCHVIAMGATEAYGANRNGDGFKEAALIKFHPTFVKNAKNFRNHKNKDTKKCYGNVKASHYNEEMKRVELLVTFYNSKEAADKRGELYAGDGVLEKVAKGDDIPWSMACRVPYDICSSCFNKAASRAEYCTEDSCVSPDGIQRGGCRENLTKVAFDGHQLHVDNDRPDFFDISHLIIGDKMPGRPADRIAYGGLASYMHKAASGSIMGGAALAEAYGLYGYDSPQLSTKLAHLVSVLADYENLPTSAKTAALALAFHPSVQGMLAPPPGQKAGAWAALARENVLPDVRTFLEWELGSSEQASAAAVKVAQHLPGIYNRLHASEQLPVLLAASPYTVSAELPSGAQRQWAKSAATGHAVDAQHVEQRVMRAALRQIAPPQLKTAAAADAEIPQLAQRYALFKLALLAAMPGLDDPESADSLCELAVLQNRIS